MMQDAAAERTYRFYAQRRAAAVEERYGLVERQQEEKRESKRVSERRGSHRHGWVLRI
jgi:hypothetical protein